MILWGRGMGRHGEGWGGFLGEEGAVGEWEGRSVEGLGGISYEIGMAARWRWMAWMIVWHGGHGMVYAVSFYKVYLSVAISARGSW